MWVPVCLLGVISGYILFVGFNLTSEKYPNGGCPKILIQVFSYQVNEYLTPMDDEMIAELCKKPIAQPTEDMPIKDESTEEIAAARLRIPTRQSTDKSADAVEVAGQPAEKVPDIAQPDKDVEIIEQKTKQIEKIQDTPGCCPHHMTAPCDEIVDPAEEFIAKVLDKFEEFESNEMIDESSSDADALVKEIFRYSQAMFTPYVSPFFYLSNYTHKPAVIVQELIIKPDFNDIIGRSLMSPPYINPFLFLPLTAIDYLTTDETIESRQVVDDITKNKQTSENLQDSSDGKIIKRKGLFLSEYGSTSSEYGSTSSEYGSTSSEDGSTSSEDGSTSSEDGSASSEDGSASSEDGSASSEDGSASSEDGSASSEDGSATTEDGSATTEDVSATTEDVSATTEDGSATTEDVSATTEDVSATTEDVSATTEDVSATTEDVSATTEDVSATTEDVSATTEDVSATTEDVSATTEDVSATTEDVSATTEDVSATTEDVSATTEEKCFGISSKLCSFPLSEHFIPLKKTRIPEYCEALHDYYDCHFENLLSPKSLCGKEFSLQIAHDLMTKLCTESIIKYTKAIRCAKMAVQEDFEHCKVESVIFVEKLKAYKGTEVFENDESFESCIKSIFRNKCFSIAIAKKCVSGDFLSYGDLLSRSGAQFHCKNQEEYSRALEVARSV